MISGRDMLLNGAIVIIGSLLISLTVMGDVLPYMFLMIAVIMAVKKAWRTLMIYSVSVTVGTLFLLPVLVPGVEHDWGMDIHRRIELACLMANISILVSYYCICRDNATTMAGFLLLIVTMLVIGGDLLYKPFSVAFWSLSMVSVVSILLIWKGAKYRDSRVFSGAHLLVISVSLNLFNGIFLHHGMHEYTHIVTYEREQLIANAGGIQEAVALCKEFMVSQCSLVVDGLEPHIEHHRNGYILIFYMMYGMLNLFLSALITTMYRLHIRRKFIKKQDF